MLKGGGAHRLPPAQPDLCPPTQACTVSAHHVPAAGSLIVSAADASQRHLAILLTVYVVAYLGRSLVAFFAGFAAQLAIALITEAAAAPMVSVVALLPCQFWTPECCRPMRRGMWAVQWTPCMRSAVSAGMYG